MARIRRRELKRDRFVEEVTHQVEYLSGHRKQFVWGGIVAAVLLVGGLGYSAYASQRHAASLAALMDAIDLFHGVVTDEAPPGVKRFPTETDRVEQVTRALDAILLDYSGTVADAGASYYSGLLDRERGNLAEAQSHLEQATRGRGDEFPGLARLALGGLLLDQGESESAREHFQKLAESPTRTVSKDRALIELARTYLGSDAEQAREILQGIQTSNSPASPLAATLLEAIGEGS